jgi:hypothetical protein
MESTVCGYACTARTSLHPSCMHAYEPLSFVLHRCSFWFTYSIYDSAKQA